LIDFAKRLLRGLGVDTTRLYQRLSATSIESATREQGLRELRDRLRRIIPDISDQYTRKLDPAEFERYWEIKLRSLHAFQVQCLLEALDLIARDNLTVADIGDSSGNHAIYLKALDDPPHISRFISVNLDPVAVQKIRVKGGEAVLCRAEDLNLHDIRPDLLIGLEIIEHLSDPLRFFHNLAATHSVDHVLISVPYRRHSRFGGNLLRYPEEVMPERMTPENVHFFELCPDDWVLLTRFAGYHTVLKRIYWQYPRHGLLRLMAPLWRKLDFEGFLVLLLKRDLSLANRYTGW